jgi:carbon storage regulator CsrA
LIKGLPFHKRISFMLILSRKNQEAVVVSGPSGYEEVIRVTVLEIHGSTVKLGFEAGDGIPIHRAEVWERICGERQGAPRMSAVQTRERAPYTDLPSRTQTTNAADIQVPPTR